MRKPYLLTSLAFSCPFVAFAATAQTSDLRALENGYGNSRRLENQPFTPTTRDANGNRLIVNGIIQYDDANNRYSPSNGSGGTLVAAPDALTTQGMATATAIGNLLSVTVSGSHNTVILNSRQDNSGTVSAVLNGRKTTGE
ncbi:holdfast anchoring protein HfaA [Asticcacaulis sp.]|uniref:holdfast anchoring protein HfaA n=1 Tax=Asticcacaulis sp. TaxID=1872648 RepID=UPI0031D7216A